MAPSNASKGRGLGTKNASRSRASTNVRRRAGLRWLRSERQPHSGGSTGYDFRGLQLYARLLSSSGEGITNSYDGLGRQLTGRTTQGGIARSLAWQYDISGNRTRVTHPGGVWFTYDYDGLDRLKTVKQSGTTVIASYTYNAKGEQTGLTRGVVPSAYGYDPLSRIQSMTDDLAAAAQDVTTTFAYNPASQLAGRTRSNDLYAWPARPPPASAIRSTASTNM